MIFGSATRAFVVLAATAAFAQNAQPGATSAAPMPNVPGMAGPKGPIGNRPSDPLGLAALHEHVNDMESTLSQMRGVLKQMHARAARSKVPDPLTKANLDLWELMVGHLDKELQQLHQTLAVREDMEVRRLALYKQADAKAEAAAQAGRAAQAARFAEAQKNATGTPTPTSAAAEQTSVPSPGAQTAPLQRSAVPPTNNSASPN